MALAQQAPYIVVLRDVLSPQECQEHMDFVGRQELEPARVIHASGEEKYKPELRNHQLLVHENQGLADKLLERIRARAPELIEGARLDAINPSWRYFYYPQGAYFGPHTDIGWRDEQRLTRMTLLIYLNDDFEGGQTRFHVHPELVFRPSQGDALLFQHAIVHEGLAIEAGTKCVLRSELFYKTS